MFIFHFISLSTITLVGVIFSAWFGFDLFNFCSLSSSICLTLWFKREKDNWFFFFLSFLLDYKWLQVVGVGEEWSHIPFVGIIICLVTNSFSIAPLRIIDTRSHTWHYNNKKTTYYYYFKEEGISYLISNPLNFYLKFKIYPKYLIFIDS